MDTKDGQSSAGCLSCLTELLTECKSTEIKHYILIKEYLLKSTVRQ